MFLQCCCRHSGSGNYVLHSYSCYTLACFVTSSCIVLLSTASTAFIPPYPDAPSRALTLPPSTPKPTENDSASDTAPAAYVSPIKKKRKKVLVYTRSDEEVWELEDAVSQQLPICRVDY